MMTAIIMSPLKSITIPKPAGTNMFDDFFFRAMLAGIGIALITGPIGCFIVWRRMAYFGDATSHAAILGVALALALNLPIAVGTLVVAVAWCWLFPALARRDHLVEHRP